MGVDVVIMGGKIGLYQIKGNVSIVAQGGLELEQEQGQVRLCGGDQLVNKPVCDDSEKGVEFDSKVEARPALELRMKGKHGGEWMRRGAGVSLLRCVEGWVW
ncbi:CDGSH iron-sulfur domain-containing protein [Ralstonia solanacearum]|uniref:CDGSH iron-sulfur domain-containing protein n=1 Tax=Ralstonia solanacearum TaxID=305 RepID=UPI000A9D529B|nr:CDGSH iron-sulfur domain-containing protein [Ralstonia solanacearum]